MSLLHALKTTPENLFQVVWMVIKSTPISKLEEIRHSDELEHEIVDQWHFFGGMAARNNLGLWGKNKLTEWFNSVGITHADDMSGIIGVSAIRSIRGEAIKLDEQVAYYQEYWLKSIGKRIP